MRTIAFTNQKGGVGKTTTTVNLAGILAERGKKVMLIDLDPQAHLTTFIGIDPREVEISAHEVLTRSASLEDALIEVRENILLLSSGLDLAASEIELVSVVGRETILRDALKEYGDRCDYVLIDCPPSLGLLTLNALATVEELIIPLQPHFLSLQGLSQLLESILLVHNRINRNLRVSGLIFCMFDSRLSLTNEIVADIEAFLEHQREQDTPWKDARIFQSRIRRNVKLAESPSYGQTIMEYDKSSNGAADYLGLADELQAMAGEIELAASEEQANSEMISSVDLSADQSQLSAIQAVESVPPAVPAPVEVNQEPIVRPDSASELVSENQVTEYPAAEVPKRLPDTAC